MDGFNKLVLRWSERFYTEPLLGVCELLALIFGILFVRKQLIGVLFILYILFDFVAFLVDMYLVGFSSFELQNVNRFFFVTNTIIALIELGVYYIFFYILLPGKKLRIYLLASIILFAIIVINYIISVLLFNKEIEFRAKYVGAIEFLLLIPLCFKYYLKLFQTITINLFKRPSFWVVTGIFFFSIISLPFYLLEKFLFTYNYAYYESIAPVLFNAPFAVNFIFLSIAFLCKRPLTS